MVSGVEQRYVLLLSTARYPLQEQSSQIKRKLFAAAYPRHKLVKCLCVARPVNINCVSTEQSNRQLKKCDGEETPGSSTENERPRDRP